MPDDQGPRHTIQVIYHGRVQGVGFRATTADLARRFPVTGYVRNQPDRTVELVVQGDPEVITQFQQAISAQFQGYILHAIETPWPKAEKFDSFRIRR